jgi:predicted secreted protein
MGWVTGIVVYILIWWVALFAILPLRVTPTEPGDTGYGTGAPKRPHLRLKLGLTSAVAAVLWIGVYILIKEPWFSFRGG